MYLNGRHETRQMALPETQLEADRAMQLLLQTLVTLLTRSLRKHNHSHGTELTAAHLHTEHCLLEHWLRRLATAQNYLCRMTQPTRYGRTPLHRNSSAVFHREDFYYDGDTDPWKVDLFYQLQRLHQVLCISFILHGQNTRE